MFQVTGTILNLFDSPGNEKYDPSYKVQLLGDNPLQDGKVKKEMLTLSVPRSLYDQLQGRIGSDITLPVGMFVKSGQLNVYFPKSAAVALDANPAPAGEGSGRRDAANT